MDLRVQIREPTGTALNQPAHDGLVVVTTQFAEAVLAEAMRLAERFRGDGTTEVTSSFIHDAALLIRRGYTKRRTPWLLRLCRVVAAISALIVGALYDSSMSGSQV